MNFSLWIQGLLHCNIWQMLMITLVMTHITSLSMTIYLHRYSAHRSVDLHPLLRHFFRFWLWFTSATNTKEWTAIHRKHHAKCETVDDPHSPVHYGLNRVLWGGAFLYRKEAKNQQTLERYGKGCPDDWIERKLYTPQQSLGIFILLAAYLLMFGVWGVLAWGIQMVWVPFWAAGVVNGVGHIFGYRNFECSDNARNIFPVGIIMGGEELHNNHHAYPNSARLSSKWWEFDCGWMWIRIFCMLRLAKVLFSTPLIQKNKHKAEINTNTIMAIVNHRFHVMAHYTKDVIRPLINSEKGKFASKQERMRLHKAGKLLSRHHAILKPVHQAHLKNIISEFNRLKIIYEKRIALQEIWQKIKENKQRVNALQKWCLEAEQSGIQVLRDFSKKLRCYDLPT
ncbi:MAG: fatty acid desaturase [Endozoicomonadaceae bacterium]|nr:fatty acid desaturase [Endozoicomonadaceae bacterium]